MTIFSLLTKTAGTTPVAEIVAGRCLRGRLSSFDCTRCLDSCAAKALSLQNGKIHIDNTRCTGCGRCTAVCPAEALVFAGFDLCRMLDEYDSFADYVFNCPRQKQAFPKELPLPCIGVLSIEALLSIALKGNGPVYFNLLACPDCPQFEGVAAFVETLDRLQKTLAPHLGTDLRAIRAAAQLPGVLPGDRRSFLLGLGSNVVSLVQSHYAAKSPLSKKQSTRATSRRLPEKTALLEKVLMAQDSALVPTLLAQCTPTLSLNDSCTLCPRCTGMCPTGAIKLVRQEDNSKQLSFAGGRCTGCGLCVAFCKMRAITINPGLMASKSVG
ncbi:4Fe-4S dicluster domain-containing protein [Desulfocastanea catecholica]